MHTINKIGYLSAIATILSISASFASGKPPAEEGKKSTTAKIGREVARVEEQAKAAVSNIKHGHKEGKEDFKNKYRDHPKPDDKE